MFTLGSQLIKYKQGGFRILSNGCGVTCDSCLLLHNKVPKTQQLITMFIMTQFLWVRYMGMVWLCVPLAQSLMRLQSVCGLLARASLISLTNGSWLPYPKCERQKAQTLCSTLRGGRPSTVLYCLLEGTLNTAHTPGDRITSGCECQESHLWGHLISCLPYSSYQLLF